MAGTFIGNGLLYALLAWLVRSGKIASSRIALAALYFLALMCAGNVFGYVPIYGLVTQLMALFSKYALFPLSALYLVSRRLSGSTQLTNGASENAD